ncbi:MAG: integrase [Sulfurospirillum sp.]|nr:MAG: integrase [Sulfurospirillum sp.]
MRDFLKKRVSDYLHYLQKIRHYSPLTLKTYKSVLFEGLEYVLIDEQGKIIVVDLIPYRNRLVNLNKRTIYKKITIFRSFFEYLKEDGFECKLKGDESIKLPKTLPKPISLQHLNEALDVATLEERVILYLFFALGIRISELCSLKVKDISQKWVNVKGKGGKIRQIPILEELHELLDEFVKKEGCKEYLFEKDGKSMSQNQIRYRFGKVFEKIGIKVTPHQLRHTFATTLLNQGARINDVSQLLGHSWLSTTQIYTKLSATAKMRNYQEAHPLCRSENESG